MEDQKKLKINNLPDYAGLYDYVVYRSVNGEAWFLGAYNSVAEAQKAAEEVHGYIEEVRNIDTV